MPTAPNQPLQNKYETVSIIVLLHPSWHLCSFSSFLVPFSGAVAASARSGGAPVPFGFRDDDTETEKGCPGSRRETQSSAGTFCAQIRGLAVRKRWRFLCA